MTFAQMQARVLLYIKDRPNLDQTVKDVINEEADGLALSFKFPNLEINDTVVATVDNPASALVSTIYAVTNAFIQDEDYRRELSMMEAEWYDQQNPLHVSLTPTHYMQRGTTLIVYPTPDYAYTIGYRGVRLPTTMVADGDESELPRDWHPIIVKMAASEMLFMVGEDERAMSIKNEALGDIQTRQEVYTLGRRGKVGQISIARRSPRYAARRPYGTD